MAVARISTRYRPSAPSGTTYSICEEGHKNQDRRKKKVEMKVLSNETIGVRRLVLIQFRTIYYVDYDEQKRSAEEIFLRKNRTGKVYSFLEDAKKQFEIYRNRLGEGV